MAYVSFFYHPQFVITIWSSPAVCEQDCSPLILLRLLSGFAVGVVVLQHHEY
jgi:hypothetical protein